jgi:hypothetical protein
MKFVTSAVVAVGFLAGGCATVTRGTTEDVVFSSEPSGAQMTTSLNHSCTTPCTIEIKRRDKFTATFRLGEQEKQVFVDTVVAGEGVAAGAGNILIGGLVGATVDVVTGAGVDHTPNPVHVVFDPIVEEPPEADPDAMPTPITEGEPLTETAATDTPQS